MKRIFSDMFLVVIMFLCAASSEATQSQNDKMARAYYFEAERALSMEKYSEALTAIRKTEDLLGEPNASTKAMEVKIAFGTEQYYKAKQLLNEFYTFDAGDNLAREMATYLTRIEAKIEEKNAQFAAEQKAHVAKIERDRLAAIAKAERDKQASIKAKNDRIRADKVKKQKTEKAEKDRLAKLMQEKIERAALIKQNKLDQQKKDQSAVERIFKKDYGTIASSILLARQCEGGNVVACVAAEKLIPDKQQRAIDSYYNCGNGVQENRGASCYAYARLISDKKFAEELKVFLNPSYTNGFGEQYLRAKGISSYRHTIPHKPIEIYASACAYDFLEACYENAILLERAVLKNVLTDAVRVQMEEKILSLYEMSCETTNAEVTSKGKACARRDYFRSRLQNGTVKLPKQDE